MKAPFLVFALLFAGSGALYSCGSRQDAAKHEQEMHAGAKPKPAAVAAPIALRDTLLLLAQQLDTVRRIGCWDDDFAHLMTVHHAGAQRLAAVQVSQGKDATLRALAQHVLKSHERDQHVLTLALHREPPAGQEYRPGNAKDPFVRRIAAALAPLRQPPTASGSVDTDFAALMRLHHQSGVTLAKTELAFGRNAQLKAAARAIVRDQQLEIRQYQRWLQARAASPGK